MGDLHLHVDPDPAASLDALLHEMTHRRFLGEQADPDRAADAARAWGERVLPRSRRLRVVVDDVERGHVWVSARDGDLTVLGLGLDDRALAGAVRTELVTLASAEGARRLAVGVAPGDPVLEELVRGGGFEVNAVQMRLDLDHPLAPGGADGADTADAADTAADPVVLTPFDDAEYAAFAAVEVEEYAAVRERAGDTPEVARRTAEESHAELLPDGLATPDQHFFTARVDDVPVGLVWIGTERPMAFVYNVVVHEEHRRRGYAGAMVRSVARWSHDRGAHALGLNVFGYNHGARALYDRLGFHVVERFVTREVAS